MSVEENKVKSLNEEDEFITFELRKDYIVTKPRIEFYKHITSTYKNIAIITVFYDKCTKIRRFLETECNKESKIVVSTPNNFLGLKIENHFVIIEDPHLIGPFGYLETIKKIKNNNSLIALTDKALKYEFLKDPIMVSSTRKCFIKCNNEESFIILFCVIKFNIIRDDLSVVVVSKEMKTKVQIFLKVFGYEGFNRVYLPEECEGGRILAFSDTLLEIEGVDVIYLSKKNIEGIKESQFDFKKADKFIYRIRNVLQSITPSIFKGKKEFDFEKFGSLRETFN